MRLSQTRISAETVTPAKRRMEGRDRDGSAELDKGVASSDFSVGFLLEPGGAFLEAGSPYSPAKGLVVRPFFS